jgi:hypothetical protein
MVGQVPLTVATAGRAVAVEHATLLAIFLEEQVQEVKETTAAQAVRTLRRTEKVAVAVELEALELARARPHNQEDRESPTVFPDLP